MNDIQAIHRAETIDYVLGQVRTLHQTETDRAAFYNRQPYAAALETIARDRAFRLGQLVCAIEAGLFDQLDADATTEAFVDVADAERNAQRDEYVNSDEDEQLADWERELLALPEGEPDPAAERAFADMDATADAEDARLAEENEAAKDAEAKDDAWSTAEQVEHDQACEARIDAADAERWAQGGAPF